VHDRKAERRPVRIGGTQGGQVTVLEGLQGGEAVVVDAPGRLREGRAVELQVGEK
jgi:multidrug efflux pump subunit AcrA (membrane-fusion protein)